MGRSLQFRKDPVNILDTKKPPEFLEMPPWWMCVILYNTCETGHIESSVLLSLSASCLATNEKIAITHLWHAIEPETMYHLIAKDKVAEQHILGKHSNCNTFLVTIALLNSRNFKVAIT